MTENNTKRIGIFGGAFDPVHLGHTEAAEIAISELRLDRLFILPTAAPPHKTLRASDNHRLTMTRDAFDGAKMTVSDYEFRVPTPSYTVKTIQHYKNEFPKDKLFLILGGDMLETFPQWDSPKKITEMVSIAAIKRIGKSNINESAARVREMFDAEVIVLKEAPREVSSSRVRVNIMFGFPVPDLKNVTQKYILKEKLYREHSETAFKLRKSLSGMRFTHTYNTVLKGLELQKVTRVDPEKVLLACLLHDCAKEIKAIDYSRYGFNSEGIHHNVAHAFLGAIVAEKDYGISDPDILNAVRYHSTGRAGMSTLEKLVYLADSIEDSRKIYCRPERIALLDYYVRILCEEGFEAAFRAVIKATYERIVLVIPRDEINRYTEEAYEYYVNAKKN